jgi:WD40 repeat protein
LSKDGTLIATSIDDYAILWDAKTLKEKGRVVGEPYERPVFPGAPWRHEVVGVRFSPDGRYLIANTGECYRINKPGVIGFESTPYVGVWDVGTKKQIRRIKDIQLFAVSPDNKTIACGKPERQGDIWLYDFTTSKELGILKGLKKYTNAVTFSCDGSLLAAGSEIEKTVRIWDIATHKEVFSFDAPDRSLALAFSSNGKELAIGGYWSSDNNTTGDDGCSVIRVYDLSPRKLYVPLIIDGRRVSHMQFSPDGKRLAVTSEYRHACVWDVKTRKKVAEFDGGADKREVGQIIFTPDGKTVLLVRGKTVELWPMPKGDA